MLNTRLFRSATIALSVFGLISCAADKKSKTDDFQIGLPQLQVTSADSKNGEPPKMMAFDLALGKILPAEAELVFPSLLSNDFANNPVVITMASSCTTGSDSKGQTFTQNRIFKNVSRIPLLIFLPNSFLLTPASETLSYNCTFKFSAENKHTSTHNFTFANVQIASLEKTATLFLQGPHAETRLDERLIIPQESLYQTSFVLGHQLGAVNVALHCDHYDNDRDYQDLKDFNLADLTLAPLHQSGADSRTIYWQQHCRLITTPQGRAENMEISRIFEIRFSPLPLKYKMHNVVNPGDRHAFAGLIVNNPNPVGQLLALNLPNVKIHYSNGADADSALRIESYVAEKQTNNMKWYEIPANSTIEIKFYTLKDINAGSDEISPARTSVSTNEALQILRTAQVSKVEDIKENSNLAIDMTDSIDSFTMIGHD